MDPQLLVRGLILGFTIAAAVGPIALLCIRRTLAEGRLVGFVSGMGVATADATYGALADYAIVLYRRYRGMDGGMEYRKLLHLMQRAGFSAPRLQNDDDLARTLDRKGECWPAKISIFGDEGDHWILVGRDIFLHDLARLFGFLERHRLLRFQHRFRDPRIAAIDAGDRIILGQIIESGGAFRAATLRAPFSLDHICLVTLWKQDRNIGRATVSE